MKSRKILLPILLGLLVLAGFIALVPPMVALGKRAVGKAGEIATNIYREGAASLWEDNRACLLDPDKPNPHVLLLKEYAPAQAGSIPADFYTYFGFRDWWRYPLVYPYSLFNIDTIEHASLVAWDSGADIRSPGAEMVDAGISGITELTFDQKTLLVKAGRKKYHLFDFTTRQVATFPSETTLFSAARALNFQGTYRLMTIVEYGELFSCPE